nr:hypothetical protein [Kibdelosporangium sp. MJ126-NF4]
MAPITSHTITSNAGSNQRHRLVLTRFSGAGGGIGRAVSTGVAMTELSP